MGIDNQWFNQVYFNENNAVTVRVIPINDTAKATVELTRPYWNATRTPVAIANIRRRGLCVESAEKSNVVEAAIPTSNTRISVVTSGDKPFKI